MQREPERTLVLSETAARSAAERPRAYADHGAFGLYTSPPLPLAQPVTRVTATLAADLPPGAETLLEVRGQAADGRWSTWAELEPDGAPAELDTAVALSYRLTLLGDGPAKAGPRVRAASFGLRADGWRLAAAAAQASPFAVPAQASPFAVPAQASPFAIPAGAAGAMPFASPVTGPLGVPQVPPTAVPPTMRVWATREGLVGARTANGHVIESNDRFVALPSRKVLNQLGGNDYTVTIHYKGRSATVPVWDWGRGTFGTTTGTPAARCSRTCSAGCRRRRPRSSATTTRAAISTGVSLRCPPRSTLRMARSGTTWA